VFIIRWWRFLRGFVVISLQGRGVERLLNLAVSRGIGFWDLQKQKNEARLSVSLASFRALRPLLRKARCRLRIRRKVGLPFVIYRLRRRWGLVAGALFFVAALYLATSLVWEVRVTGNRHLGEAEILALAEQLGIRPGAWKWKLNLSELEEELPRRHKDIAWAGLRFYGTVLEIEIAEHLPELTVDQRPADIVAAKDGLVERVLVIEGRAVVKVGDTVSKGDLLIEGVVPIEEGFLEPGETAPVKEVRARGEVEARIWYEVRVPLKLRQLSRELTGASQKSVYLRWQDKQWRLWGPAQNPYPSARQEARVFSWRWRSFSFPVELVTLTYLEQRIIQKTFSRDEALKAARQEARQRLQAQLPKGVAIERLYEQEYSENGTDWIRVVGETREGIGMVKLRRP